MAEQEQQEVGSIRLWFENCNAGTVSYDLPGISARGVSPIQRVALDNVVICESLDYTAAQ